MTEGETENNDYFGAMNFETTTFFWVRTVKGAERLKTYEDTIPAVLCVVCI